MLVEFHAMPARPYLRISAFGIHDLFRRVIGNYSWPKRRTGENEALSSENDARAGEKKLRQAQLPQYLIDRLAVGR